jgi:hypothetical protein
VVQLIVVANCKPFPQSAECSCGRQDRSALSRIEDTSVVAPCDPTEPETA